MGLLRYLILGLMGYFLVRWIIAPKKKHPRVNKSRARKEVDPFKSADIEDVSYTELPPDQEKEDRTGQNSVKES